MEDHKDRAALTGEAHARPTLSGQTPCVAVHEAVIDAGLDDDVWAYLNSLPLVGPQSGGDTGAVHRRFSSKDGELKWERHGEFSGYTTVTPGLPSAADPQSGWPPGRPGKRIAAIRITVLPAEHGTSISDELRKALEDSDCAVSLVNYRKALMASNFRPGDDGFIELTIWNISLSDRQLGRVLRRMFEIETYRIMALLAFPLARSLRPRLDHLEIELRSAIERMGNGTTDPQTVATEEAILATVSGAARIAEQYLAESEFRFSAAEAYGRLVLDRLEELREERVEGFQRLGTFLRRRFTPAIDTVAAVRSRLSAISVRIERASALLRTRIDLERQQHNQNLLASMDRRARIQARLQETVESLSVVAITYYAFSLASKAITPLRDTIPIPRDWQDPVLIGCLLACAFGITHLVRRSIQREEHPEAPSSS